MHDSSKFGYIFKTDPNFGKKAGKKPSDLRVIYIFDFGNLLEWSHDLLST